MSGKKSAEHGTRTQYRAGCRCDECRAANAAYVRERRRAKSGKRPQLRVVHGGVPVTSASVTGAVDDVPVTVAAATAEAVAQVSADDPWTASMKTLALRLAREIDSPSTSMSVAPIVQQWRDVMEVLRSKDGSNDRFGGLPAIIGSRS